MDLFDLVATLTLDTSKYTDSASEAVKGAQSLGGKIKSALGTAGKVGAAAMGAVTTGTIALTSAMLKGVSQTAAYGDEIDKASQKLGLSAQAYQEWDAILKHSGTDINAMTGAMRTLTNAANSGKTAFQELGISQEQMASMSKEELFAAAIEGLQNVTDEMERSRLATELLGRGSQELGALLNTSAEETEAMRQRVHELGGVMSDEAVKAAAAYQDSLQDMQTAFAGLQRNLTATFMPSVTKVMDGLTELFAGNSGTGLSLIKEGINDLVTNLTEQIPGFIEVGTEIVLALGDAIIENLPTLIDAGVQGLMAIVDGIIDHLPEIMTSGLRIVGSLVSGLIKAIPQLVAAIPRLISAIVQGFLSYASELMGIGRNIVEGIKTGITNAWKGLVNSVTNLGKNLLSKVKGLFGIHSPSKVFAQIGGYMAEGLGEGWEDEFASVQKDITAGLDFSKAYKSPQIEAMSGLQQSVVSGYDMVANGVRTQLEGLKIYLSTGELVGGIAPTMNNTLGNAYVQDIRGAMA